MTKLQIDGEAEEFITIVSGLPRSGTSMVMRMLEAGGMPIVTDEVRQADEDNPGGYYEYEGVKHLSHDAKWLNDVYGKAVKVVAHHLYDLPSEHTYRIIFLDRKLEEVAASQRLMLKHRGACGAMVNDQVLIELLKVNLQQLDDWFRDRPYLPVLYLRYSEIVADPVSAASDIEHFLDSTLCITDMANVVDPHLYRTRRGDTA